MQGLSESSFVGFVLVLVLLLVSSSSDPYSEVLDATSRE